MITLFNIGLTFLSSKTASKEAFPGSKSAEALRVLSLLEGRLITEGFIKREGNGRPFFPGNFPDFNISHSGDMTAVSLARERGMRTGCDIQRIKKRANTMQIAGEFFSAGEQKYIMGGGMEAAGVSMAAASRFHEIWVLKECYIKLKGLSVFDMASAPSFIRDDGSAFSDFTLDETALNPVSFYLYELNGGPDSHYMLAVCIEGCIPPKPVIQWFSQDSLPVRSIAEIKAARSPALTVSPKM